MNKTAAFIAPALIALALPLAQAGEITGTITLKGTPPPEKDITPLKSDPNCGKLHTDMPKTRFYVLGSKGELADVVVSIQGGNVKSTGASAEPVVMDQKGCEYVPQILVVQTDQKVRVKNSDPVLHNVHTQPIVSGNKEQNLAQVPGAQDLVFSFSKPEEFLKFKCDVHPWMFAWVTVFDHPLYAISGKDGTYKIANVPAGKYTIKANHRKAGVVSQEVEVKDGATQVDFVLEAK